MEAEIKALWIERLRSGQIQQGKNLLRDIDDRMCCLGVLCEIAVERGVIPPPELLRTARHSRFRYSGQHDTFLPRPVKEWAQLQVSEQKYATLNDEMNQSFNEIAGFISENE
jgi:hypothetical protein